MKKGWGILIVLLAMTFGAMGQEGAPRVDRRQHQQLARIRHGLATGDLTRREAYRLLKQQQHIRRREHLAKADDRVTRRERMNLHRTQARANRHIYFQRHDRQSRLN